MHQIPKSMKTRRSVWSDRYFVASVIANVAMLVLWLVAKIFPQWKLVFFLGAPLPSPIGDIGLFIPLHVWMGYYMYKWKKDSLRWTNPALCLINNRYSIDSKFGTDRVGDHAVIATGAFDTQRAGQTWPESFHIVRWDDLDPKDKDFWSDTRDLPIKQLRAPPLVCDWLQEKGVSPDVPIFMCFREEEFVVDPKTGIAPVQMILNQNALINTFPLMEDGLRNIFVSAVDDAAYAKDATRRGGRPAEPPQDIAALERSRAIVIEERT